GAGSADLLAAFNAGECLQYAEVEFGGVSGVADDGGGECCGGGVAGVEDAAAVPLDPSPFMVVPEKGEAASFGVFAKVGDAQVTVGAGSHAVDSCPRGGQQLFDQGVVAIGYQKTF